MWKGLLAVSLLVVWLSGCGQKMVNVRSGEKVICSQCGKVVKSDIRTSQVQETEMAKYSVREIREICPVCQQKIDAQNEKRRLAEEARQRRIQQQETRGRIVGTWICQFGGILGNVVIHLYADGTGKWQAPLATVRWENSGNGFTATASWVDGARSYRSRFSGQLSSGGNNLLVEGWGAFGFGSSQNAVFERM